MSAVRIQRRRTKGWRMTVGAMYVGRPSRWGNPFRLQPSSGRIEAAIARMMVVRLHRRWVTAEVNEHLTIDLEPLRGRDLVCWCSLDQPCHADVLLELANR